ncbi:sulfite exporter TauE/SafE family protein [Ammoniphilus sp. CFH 90114]|uniref:sulfite exporter TauE/SafE family protein n=1 Tax=Ammoniphilus sp. CFH 90114 TaxID=2493665 RepID=UPI0013E99717|nr:sulfite exporter TauE/SafE family protein [Ammoniphilus sp. CFH 90114]
MFITMLVIGILGGILTGMMSVGGGLILIFLLLFIPPFLGYSFTMHEIAGMVIIQTIFSGSSGLYSYWKRRLINTFLIKYMGLSSFIGGFIGVMLSELLSHNQLLAIFAALSLVATITMFFKPKPVEGEPYENKSLAIVLGLGIGVLGGMFGLGAGFLYMPIMLILYRIQTKHAVGTGLALAILLCLGALFGKVTDLSVPWQAGTFLALGAIPGAQLGSYLGQRMKTESLRRLMAISVAIVSVKIWIDLLQELGVSPSLSWTFFLIIGVFISAIVQVYQYNTNKKQKEIKQQKF